MARSPRAERPLEFDVELGALAGHVRPACLDREAVLVEGRALEKECRQPALLAEQTRLAARQEDRLERLVEPLHVAVVAPGEEVVQRTVLEVRVQELREPVRGQPDLLEQERHVGGTAPALQEDDRGTGREPQCLGDGLTGRLTAGRQQLRARRQPMQLHLLGEAERGGQVAHDPGRRHERPPAPRPLESLLAGKVGQGSPYRDEAAAVPFGELRAPGGRRCPTAQSPLWIRASRST